MCVCVCVCVCVSKNTINNLSYVSTVPEYFCRNCKLSCSMCVNNLAMIPSAT